VVIERLWRTYLKSLRYASSYPMAIIAIQSFVLVVLRMTEANAKRLGHLSCATVTP
jgi:hypothetical protein